MLFTLRIDGQDHQIVIGTDGTVSVGDDSFAIESSPLAADRRVVQVDDRSYEVRIIEQNADTGAYVLEIAGERIAVEVTDLSSDANGAITTASGPAPSTRGAVAQGTTAASPADSGGKGIRAPMPGKIADVFVQAGQTVKEGDSLLVLEAMKMENELRAPSAGSIAAVLVKRGDPVERGQMLVTLD